MHTRTHTHSLTPDQSLITKKMQDVYYTTSLKILMVKILFFKIKTKQKQNQENKQEQKS